MIIKSYESKVMNNKTTYQYKKLKMYKTVKQKSVPGLLSKFSLNFWTFLHHFGYVGLRVSIVVRAAITPNSNIPTEWKSTEINSLKKNCVEMTYRGDIVASNYIGFLISLWQEWMYW